MQLVHGQMLDQLTQSHDEAVCTAIFNNAAHDLTIVKVFIVVFKVSV